MRAAAVDGADRDEYLGQDLEAAEAIAAENRPGVHVRLYGKTEPAEAQDGTHYLRGHDSAEYGAVWADRFVK